MPDKKQIQTARWQCPWCVVPRKEGKIQVVDDLEHIASGLFTCWRRIYLKRTTALCVCPRLTGKLFHSASRSGFYQQHGIRHRTAIIAEEAGECLQAGLNCAASEDKNKTACIREAIHTAAVAIRFLQNQDLSDYGR